MNIKLEIEEIVKPIPKRVFIVPYRNRIQHKFFFCKYMTYLLEDNKDYEIYFSHQCDSRTFNRGAAKNIGFLAIKEKYPQDYKDITFIFNDIDTVPFYKIFDYQTKHGVVKHHYGFKYALGGIVVIKGADFERINGYPCYWGWGMEDTALQKRCESNNIMIDRSNFYEIGKPQILQLFDGVSRIISKTDSWRDEDEDDYNGLLTITSLNYTLDKTSANPNDNIISLDDARIFYVNIKSFFTHLNYEEDEYYSFDLRDSKKKLNNPSKSLPQTNKFVSTADDWSNIPYYPTNKEKRQIAAANYIKNGKQIPIALLNQIQKDEEDTIKNDVYNISVTGNNIHQPRHLHQYKHQPHPQLQPQKEHLPPYPPPSNKYSPHHANFIGARPRSMPSARIKLGGAY